MNAYLDRKSGFFETLPTIFGYLGIGIAFGLIGISSHIQPVLVILMSAIIYGGSAQFIAVTMIATHSPIISVVLSVFLVNSRMILLSMTVAPYLKQESMLKNILIGSLITDESFALSMNKLNYTEGHLNFEWFNMVNIVAYLTWVIATAIGTILGNLIANPQKLGLNFAVVAMFIGLLYLQIIADKSIQFNLQLLMVVITLGLMYLCLVFIPENIAVLIVTLVGCGIGVMIKHVFY